MLHFLHISKAGGTAIKHAIRKAGNPETPFGKVRFHEHRVRLEHLPPNHHTFFCIRDPIARFTSGFYSRLRKGQPRYYYEWRSGEAEAFKEFLTPQALAQALASPDGDTRERATQAMSRIQHVRQHLKDWLISSEALRERADRIVYIARQETLAADWISLREALRLPEGVELPDDPVAAHRGGREEDRSLDEQSKELLREWYKEDYRIIEVCEEIRRDRRWGPYRNSS